MMIFPLPIARLISQNALLAEKIYVGETYVYVPIAANIFVKIVWINVEFVENICVSRVGKNFLDVTINIVRIVQDLLRNVQIVNHFNAKHVVLNVLIDIVVNVEDVQIIWNIVLIAGKKYVGLVLMRSF